MSHFSVLVIGTAPVKEQLAPYDENTEVPPYKERVSPEDLAKQIAYYQERWNGTDIVVQADGSRHHVGVHQRGFGLADQPFDYPATDPTNPKMVLHDYFCKSSGELLIEAEIEACPACGWDEDGAFVITVYNPRSKWDWYVEGGRWDGMLRTRDGRQVNACTLGDLDVPAMLEARRQEVTEAYQKFASEISPDDLVWVTEEGAYGEDPERFKQVGGGGAFMYGIEPMGTWNADGSRDWSPDTHLPTFEQHVGQKTRWSTYAVVRDGVWHSRAKMGMFGSSSGEDPEQVWYENFATLTGTGPPETPVTLVDAHI